MTDDELRSRVRSFLADTCPPADPSWDPPSGVLTAEREPGAALIEAVEFQRALAAAGLAGLTVPRAYGGAGLGPWSLDVFAQEAVHYAVPSTIPLSIGLAMAVPTLLAHGREDQRVELIPPALEAVDLWCQLFSEPDAGSDLASLRTSARLEGDRYVVHGQKVWSSFANKASHGLLLARTDPDAPRHHGITLFALPMSTPGIEVRPLREITGGTHFCEVFLDGVEIDPRAIIGEPEGGWRTAMSTLVVERRGPESRRGRPRWQRLVDLAGDLDPSSRQAVARIHTMETAIELLVRRIDQLDEANSWRGSGGSLVKLGRTGLEQEAALLATQLLGARSTAWAPDDEVASGVVQWCLGSRAGSIAAGTDEVQRNLIGERLLGLPPEPRSIPSPADHQAVDRTTG